MKKLVKNYILAFFALDCFWPTFAYIAYFYCGGILKNSFGYSAEQVIHQNFIVSLLQMLSWLVIAFLSYKIYPLKILRMRLFIFCLLS